MSRLLMVFALSLGFVGFSILASAEVEVEVEFSDRVANVLGRIDRIELRREGYFRQYSVDLRSRLRSTQRLNNSMFSNTEWAGELLIPELENYSLENLLRALVVESINRAGIEFDGTVQIELERIKVKNHSVSLIANGNTYAKGRFTAIDASGQVVRSAEISANLVLDYTTEISYDGPDFAFYTTDPENRIGPTLAFFVKKGLSALFPGNDFPRAVVIEF